MSLWMQYGYDSWGFWSSWCLLALCGCISAIVNSFPNPESPQLLPVHFCPGGLWRSSYDPWNEVYESCAEVRCHQHGCNYSAAWFLERDMLCQPASARKKSAAHFWSFWIFACTPSRLRLFRFFTFGKTTTGGQADEELEQQLAGALKGLSNVLLRIQLTCCLSGSCEHPKNRESPMQGLIRSVCSYMQYKRSEWMKQSMKEDGSEGIRKEGQK